VRLRLLLFLATLGLAAAAVQLATRRPSNDRPWTPEHARAPRITFDGSVARIDFAREFRWADEVRFTPRWTSRRVDLDRIESAWLVLAPFSRAWRGPAHAFVSFGFDDSTYLAVSVEARREVGEEYGVLRGLGRAYELIYVVGDEEDLIGKRARGSFDLYLYPIRAPREKIRAVFRDVLERAGRLADRPEFYHTATNSCTSNLVRHVNRATPGRIPAGLRLLIPGYADAVARELGLLAEGGSIDDLRRRFRIDSVARSALGQDDFSRRIRAAPPGP
jgi:hypothetical protein